MSVKFSKVGKTTFDKYKNLEWVVCRSHGVDMVNLDECKRRNIGVVALSPTSVPCANWIKDKILDDQNVLIFGNGAISRKLQSKLNDFKVVDSSTPKEEIQELISWAKTIVSTLPLTDKTKNYFDRNFFQYVKEPVNFISLSRGELFDNSALLEMSSNGKIKFGVFDMLVTDGRELLSKQKNIRYTEHTAWCYNQPMENGKLGGYVNSSFAENLKKVIDECLNGEVQFAHLQRNKNVWF